MKQRIATGAMRERSLDLGIATSEEMDAMVAAWDRWTITDDATFCFVSGELLIRISHNDSVDTCAV